MHYRRFHDAAMTTDLSPFFAALAELDERTLVTLYAAANNSPHFAPGLLAWIEHACEWELNRRRGGLDFPLLPPESVIEMIEHAVDLETTAALRIRFASEVGPDTHAMTRLMDAITQWLWARGTSEPGQVSDLGRPATRRPAR